MATQNSITHELVEEPSVESRQEFRIGLSMSGAISAGAYTAGVFDFLIEALEQWEKARSGPNADAIPDHRVGIPILAGASAGAITAAVGAAALADEEEPTFFGADSPLAGKLKYTIRKLYESWVDKPTFLAKDPKALDFVDLSDIDPTKKKPGVVYPPDYSHTSGFDTPAVDAGAVPVASVLNTRVLDGIADLAITPSGAAAKPPRPYVSKTLHLYMTLANLRGVPYSIEFVNGDYGMLTHGDRAHFIVGGLGEWSFSSAFADKDTGRDLEAKWLFAPEGSEERTHWKDYAVCALASGAFPVGLSPRRIAVPFEAYSDGVKRRQFPLESLASLEHVKIEPCPPWPLPGASLYRFTSVDGGLIDNDPFEYARFTLRTRPANEPRATDARQTREAVIMVAPFPEPPPMLAEGQPALDIFGIVGALGPTWKDQARFKPDELVLAAHPDVDDRYLVKPVREREKYAIACGVLGGFGGFLDHSFRAHDYQLGRRNCQKFLETILTLPEDHEIVRSWSEAARANPAFRTTDSLGRPAFSLIPLVGSAREEAPLLPWPRISPADFDAVATRLQVRVYAVAAALLGQKVPQVLPWLLLRVALWLKRDALLDYVRGTILADLVRRDQIEGWTPPAALTDVAEEFRAVLAELLNPAFDQRNAAGISAAAGLPVARVEKVLEACRNAEGSPYEVWVAPWTDANGAKLYAAASRKPSLALVKKILGASLFVSKVDPPGVEQNGLLTRFVSWIRSKLPLTPKAGLGHAARDDAPPQ
ncbi:MAG: hypothetical protein C3F11_07780 [Methylocystaceae bacterium]|nr:MAG: hypothetical protein C3F11_07780 [Methylocystaceae bacterium]